MTPVREKQWRVQTKSPKTKCFKLSFFSFWRMRWTPTILFFSFCTSQRKAFAALELDFTSKVNAGSRWFSAVAPSRTIKNNNSLDFVENNGGLGATAQALAGVHCTNVLSFGGWTALSSWLANPFSLPCFPLYFASAPHSGGVKPFRLSGSAAPSS